MSTIRTTLRTSLRAAVVGLLAVSALGHAPARAAVEHTAAVPNPSLGASCGLDIALVVDHSNSIAVTHPDNPAKLRAAAATLVDALSGTPSRMSVVSFWRDATLELGLTSVLEPTGATSVKAAVDAIPFATTDPNGSTNWEAALQTAGGPAPGVDLVILLTDGRPTVNNADFSTPGVTDFADVERAILAANAVKTAGRRVMALGIGSGVDAVNLSRISGPTAGVDYLLSDFDNLGDTLRALATDLCGGTVTVRKLVDDGGTLTPSSGWTFAASGGATPSSAATDAQGVVVFDFDSLQPTVTDVVETTQSGYELVQTAGKNATCLRNGSPWATTNVGDGVRLTVGPTDIIQCTFVNRVLHPAIHLEKTGTSLARPGDPVTYEFTVENTGDVALLGVVVTDPILGLTSAPFDLAVGATHEFSVDGIAPDDDQINVAEACGLAGRIEVCDDDDHPLDVIHPAIDLVKTVTPESLSGSSGSVTYRYTVTNTGDVALTTLEVVDDRLGSVGILGELVPGGVIVFERTTVLNASDVLRNVGTVTAEDPLGRSITDNDDALVSFVAGVVVTPPPAPAPAPVPVVAAPVPEPAPVPVVEGVLAVTGAGLSSPALLGGAALALSTVLRRARSIRR